MSLNEFGYISAPVVTSNLPPVNNAPPILNRPQPSNLLNNPVSTIPQNQISGPPPPNAERFAEVPPDLSPTDDSSETGIIATFMYFASGQAGIYGTILFALLSALYIIVFMLIPAIWAFQELRFDSLYSNTPYKWIYKSIYTLTAFFFGPFFLIYKGFKDFLFK